MHNHPLAEVFGFPVDNLSEEAEHCRNGLLCPFNNKVLRCTKDKADSPLGVCSVFDGEKIHITCPVRFREGWTILEHAAEFLFPEGGKWVGLPEIRMKDGDGVSAGNVDYVLGLHDEDGRIVDFGSLEVQAVYISGNVRKPFDHYMADRPGHMHMRWTQTNVRPDYLSSSRKRLVPQLVYKGAILKSWGKKQVVAIHEAFFDTLPTLTQVPQSEADLLWLVYGLDMVPDENRYELVLRRRFHVQFASALQRITVPHVGSVKSFRGQLQKRLDDLL